jgi:hypothetical protein
MGEEVGGWTPYNASPGGEMKQRGVFEKLPGSGIWWICYFDQFGKKRREKAGTKSVATKLYGKRKQQVLEGKKLPAMFREPSVNFYQLADDALAYSKKNKRSHRTDIPRFANLQEWFGAHAAEELTPREIEYKLARVAEKQKWAPSTFNHYRSLMSLSSAGNTESKSCLEPCPLGDSSPRGQQSRSVSHHGRGKET